MLSLTPADTQATPSRGRRDEPYGARRRRERAVRARARTTLSSAVHLSSRPRRHPRRRAYPPRLEVLHHAFNRNLVQQHKITDADVVLARHLASPHTRTRDAGNKSTDNPTRPTTARDRPARTNGWLLALTLTRIWCVVLAARAPSSANFVILRGECGHLQTSRSVLSIGR